MDLTYRTELHTLNDTNFARFEALLDARFARADLQLERTLNERFGAFEERIEKRLTESERRAQAFEQRIEERLGASETRVDKRLGENERRAQDFEQRITAQLSESHEAQARQFRWIIGLWMTTTVGTLAMFAALIMR